MGKTIKKRYHQRKPRRISVWDSKRKKWKTVNAKNPDYEWKNGDFIRKPSI